VCVFIAGYLNDWKNTPFILYFKRYFPFRHLDPAVVVHLLRSGAPQSPIMPLPATGAADSAMSSAREKVSSALSSTSDGDGRESVLCVPTISYDEIS
jgi:hypothetical protein